MRRALVTYGAPLRRRHRAAADTAWSETPVGQCVPPCSGVLGSSHSRSCLADRSVCIFEPIKRKLHHISGDRAFASGLAARSRDDDFAHVLPLRLCVGFETADYEDEVGQADPIQGLADRRGHVNQLEHRATHPKV